MGNDKKRFHTIILQLLDKEQRVAKLRLLALAFLTYHRNLDHGLDKIQNFKVKHKKKWWRCAVNPHTVIIEEGFLNNVVWDLNRKEAEKMLKEEVR